MLLSASCQTARKPKADPKAKAQAGRGKKGLQRRELDHSKQARLRLKERLQLKPLPDILRLTGPLYLSPVTQLHPPQQDLTALAPFTPPQRCQMRMV